METNVPLEFFFKKDMELAFPLVWFACSHMGWRFKGDNWECMTCRHTELALSADLPLCKLDELLDPMWDKTCIKLATGSPELDKIYVPHWVFADSNDRSIQRWKDFAMSMTMP